MRRRAEAGFTLIELLVALAVFSLAVLALLNVSGESVRTAGAIEERVMAGVVADNRAVEAYTAAEPPALGLSTGVETTGGRAWRWTQTATPTPDPELLRVDVAVSAADRPRTLAAITLLRSRR